MSDDSTVDHRRFEHFGAHVLVVGGDYGQIVLAGNSEVARRAFDEIVAAARRGDRVSVDSFVVDVEYRKATGIEDRHAGLERTTRVEPAAGGSEFDDAAGTEGALAEGVELGRPESDS